MKSDAVQSIVQMEPTILKQLVTEVKETVATGIDDDAQTNKSSFGIVNMWNVRKTRRNAGRARRKATIITGISY
jgi:hypothetical protein